MNESQGWLAARDLTEARLRFPGYDISRDTRVTPPRWHAVARDLSRSPHSVITRDLAELVLLLSGGRG